MSLFPKIFGDANRIDLQVFPPSRFITCLMQLPVMPTTERYGELIADFQANRARLGKSKMMRVAWLSSADQARLRCGKLEMRFVTQPFGLGEGKLGFVNRARSGVGRWTQRGLFSVGRIFSELVCHRGILATAVVTRRPWNRCCIIGMKATALCAVCLRR